MIDVVQASSVQDVDRSQEDPRAKAYSGSAAETQIVAGYIASIAPRRNYTHRIRRHVLGQSAQLKYGGT